MRCVVQHSQNLVLFTQSSPELRVPLSPEGEGMHGVENVRNSSVHEQKRKKYQICARRFSRDHQRGGRLVIFLASAPLLFFLSRYGISLTVMLIVKILI